MDFAELKEKLKDIAQECILKGPGYAQEGVVLREARNILEPMDLEEEQLLLEAWHSLFRDAILDWGYDLNNSGAPFFHSVVRQPAAAEKAS